MSAYLPLSINNIAGVSTTEGIRLTAPYLNISGSSIEPPENQYAVNQITQTFISDYSPSNSTSEQTTAVNYFQASTVFMLVGSLLTTAPSAPSSTNMPPQLTLQINNVNGNANWILSIKLSSSGKEASVPIFQTTSNSNGEIILILTNYFNISMPGCFYLIEVTGYYMANTSLFPVPASDSTS